MNRKIRYDRILIICLAIILLILSIFYIYKRQHFDGANNKETSSPTQNSDIDTIKIELLSYTVYQSADLDFDFILANMHFSSADNLDYDLRNLKTDENISLADIHAYIDKLQAASYDLSKKNVMLDLPKDSKDADVTIFIPCSKDKKEIILTDEISKKAFNIDLSRNQGDIKELISTSGENIKTDDFDIYISDSYISDFMNQNGIEYNYPATVKIYTFKLQIKNIKEGIKINNASFIPADSNETFDALDGSFSSIRKGDKSIINQELSNGSSGALFFEIYNPEEAGITYKGKILLYFSDRQDPVEISTILK